MADILRTNAVRFLYGTRGISEENGWIAYVYEMSASGEEGMKVPVKGMTY